MRPYYTIRLAEYPDLLDLRLEGRKTCAGRLQKGDLKPPRWYAGIVCYADGTPGRNLDEGRRSWSERGVTRPVFKKKMRRYLKRKDKARVEKESLNARWDALWDEQSGSVFD